MLNKIKKFFVSRSAQFKWLGKMLFITLAVSLIGSICLQMFIEKAAEKVTDAYTSGFTQSLK